MDGTLSNIVSSVEKRGICKEPRYTHRSPRIKRLSRETIREQLARMIHDGRRDGRMNGERKREVTGGETEKCRGEGWVERDGGEDVIEERGCRLYIPTSCKWFQS